jgi:hypothetical protein
MDEYFSTGLYN